MPTIIFEKADIENIPLTNRRRLKGILLELFRLERREIDKLTYVFSSDEFLLDINRKYLNHDFYTDILTFDLSETQSKITAEIYISIERVLENGNTLSVPFREELLRVMFHGILHLCGYRDKTKREKIIMRTKEEDYLRLFDKDFVPRETR